MLCTHFPDLQEQGELSVLQDDFATLRELSNKGLFLLSASVRGNDSSEEGFRLKYVSFCVLLCVIAFECKAHRCYNVKYEDM